mgnify:CR=1 FL=1
MEFWLFAFVPLATMKATIDFFIGRRTMDRYPEATMLLAAAVWALTLFPIRFLYLMAAKARAAGISSDDRNPIDYGYRIGDEARPTNIAMKKAKEHAKRLPD